MTSTSVTNNVPSLPNPNFEIFDGKDISRWREKMKFFLGRLKLRYVLDKPCLDATGIEVTTDEATLIKQQIVKCKMVITYAINVMIYIMNHSHMVWCNTLAVTSALRQRHVRNYNFF